MARTKTRDDAEAGLKRRARKGTVPGPTKAQRKPKAPADPQEEWLTPTQIGKEEGMPAHALQLIYGYIRAGKLEAKNIEGVKGKVVRADLAREMVANRGSRGGARGPRPAGPSREQRRAAQQGRELKPGTVISHEAEQYAGKDGAAEQRVNKGYRRVMVVTHHVGSLTYVHDGEKDSFWPTEDLIARLRNGTTHIESPERLLAIVAYAWRRNENEALAKQLMDWCSGRVNEAGIAFAKLIGLKVEDLEREEAVDGED